MNALEYRLANNYDFFPTCMDYAKLLARIVKQEKMGIEEARDKYGHFTYRLLAGYSRHGGQNLKL